MTSTLLASTYDSGAGMHSALQVGSRPSADLIASESILRNLWVNDALNVDNFDIDTEYVTVHVDSDTGLGDYNGEDFSQIKATSAFRGTNIGNLYGLWLESSFASGSVTGNAYGVKVEDVGGVAIAGHAIRSVYR